MPKNGLKTSTISIPDSKIRPFIPGHGKPAKLETGFKKSTLEYLIHLNQHMTSAVEDGLDLQDAVDSLDQSRWNYLENFDLLSERNAHQVYLERESAAFE